MKALYGLIAVLAMSGIATPTAAAQNNGKLKVLNQSRVYYPAAVDKKKTYTKVGLVDSRKVFDATPEYQEISRKKLKKDSAEYLLLCQKASKRFKAAIKRTVSLGGYHLIAETGAITLEGKTLPNVTSEVLKNLSTSP